MTEGKDTRTTIDRSCAEAKIPSIDVWVSSEHETLSIHELKRISEVYDHHVTIIGENNLDTIEFNEYEFLIPKDSRRLFTADFEYRWSTYQWDHTEYCDNVLVDGRYYTIRMDKYTMESVDINVFSPIYYGSMYDR